MNTIRVINTGTEPFAGRYDGVDYWFAVGKPTDIPPEVAAHCFGFGLADKREALMRMGWLKPWGSMQEALEKLATIRFHEGMVVFEDAAELSGTLATNARPHVNRGRSLAVPPPRDEPGATA